MEAFSDSSSQSLSFTTTSTDPRKLSTMLEAIETNLSDMFKVQRVGKVGKVGKVWEQVKLTSVTCSRYRGWGRCGRSGSKQG